VATGVGSVVVLEEALVVAPLGAEGVLAVVEGVRVGRSVSEEGL